MSSGTEKRSRLNGELRGWIQLGLGILALAITVGAGWVALNSKHTEAVVRISHVESQQEKLSVLPEAVAEIRAEQRAQRSMLERVDRRLEAMAKGK